MTVAFTKVALPFGWLGNMSPHPVFYNEKLWRTTEALFQALRFDDEEIREEIRSQKSPMAAKMVAKRERNKMMVVPTSPEDLANMRMVLRLKVERHPRLLAQLLATENEEIIEDCGKRRASPWGAKLVNGVWVGENLLGRLWMELREEARAQAAQAEDSVTAK